MHPQRLISLADAARLTHWPDDLPRVPILLYHRILRPGETGDPRMTVPQDRFEQQLTHLAEAGYTCVPLSALVDYVRNAAQVPPRSFAVTFDDGFLDTYRLAWPVLQRHAITATVFLVADRIGGQSEWMRVEPWGPQLLMDREQILEMQEGGIEFGSHGLTHAHLTRLDPDAISEELQTSRARLGDLLGREVTTFAYPYGEWDTRVRESVERAGYRAAASVLAGWNHPGTDPLALRRIVVSGSDSGQALLLKMLLGDHRFRWRSLAVLLGRAAARRLGLG